MATSDRIAGKAAFAKRMLPALLVLVGATALAASDGAALEEAFDNPAQECGANAWWHWLGPNVSKYGITRDLESMKSAGLCGATVFNVHETGWNGIREPFRSAVQPGMTYMDDKWWEMFVFAANEAKRLGLRLGLHNSPGCSSSGGPWITPELAMKRLVWSKVGEPVVTNCGFYCDIARVKTTNGVYRFGYTCTGKTLNPVASGLALRCLEADKMNARAMTVHVDNLLSRLLERVQPSAPGFCFLMEGGYEAGDASWTDDFAVQFLRRRGYDPIPFLPVFAGFPAKDEKRDRQFLVDFARTRNELQTERHYLLFKRRFNAAGLEYHLQPYAGPFDSFEAAACADVPMTEFWQGKPFWAKVAQVGGSDWMCGPVARALGRNIIGAESFACCPPGDPYSVTPRDLKSGVDASIARGINRISLQNWVHQPLDARWKPGFSLGAWGTHFGENQPWFEAGKGFYRYIQRVQALMQLGSMRADDLGLAHVVEQDSDALPLSQFLTNTEVTAACRVRVKSSGREYPILSVDPQVVERKNPADRTERQALRLLGRYRKAGVHVCFNGDKRRAQAAVGLTPVFEVLAGQSDKDVIGNGRQLGDTVFFFVANTIRRPRKVKTAFRMPTDRCRVPELWYPASGEKTVSDNWTYENGRVVMTLSLDEQQSVFVVFRTPTDERERVPRHREKDVAVALPYDWTVSFSGCGLDPAPRPVGILSSWSDSPDLGVRFFSGTAEYMATFDYTGPEDAKMILDLGIVCDIAQVSVNGSPLVPVWYEPFKLDVSEYVHKGENRLRILVSNAWTNRLVGDENEPEDGVTLGEPCGFGTRGTPDFIPVGRPLMKFPDAVMNNAGRTVKRCCFSSWKYLLTDRDLRPAGLIGPVLLQAAAEKPDR